MNTVRNEISQLSNSNQIYDIKYDPSRNTDSEYRSSSIFNFENGYFEIGLGINNLSSIAHELKHAYQFEIGEFSSGHRRDGLPFYDQSDEFSAYARGELFKGEHMETLPAIYNNYKSGPLDATQLPQIILSSPIELQKLANRTHSAFRYNGVTYRMQ